MVERFPADFKIMSVMGFRQFSSTWIGEGARRMELGLPGVECEVVNRWVRLHKTEKNSHRSLRDVSVNAISSAWGKPRGQSGIQIGYSATAVSHGYLVEGRLNRLS